MNQKVQIEKKHRPAIGIPLVIIACFCNAAMATMAKLINLEYQLPNQVLVFARFSISFILLLPLLCLIPKYRPLKKVLRIKIWPPYIVRFSFGLLTIYAYFYAISKISLNSAVLLTYTSPLFIPIAVWVWKGVGISSRLWWGLIVGFLGVFLIVGNKGARFHVGYLVGLISGITAAVSYVAARLQAHSEEPICVNFYFFLSTAIVSFALCAKTFFQIAPQFSGKLWFMLLLLGLFGALFQGIIILALQWAQVRFLGAFLYFTVGFAMLLSWLVFHIKPTFYSILGLGLIILGAVLMTLLDPERQKTVNETSSS